MMAQSIWDKITEYRLQPKPQNLLEVTVFVHIFFLLLTGPITYLFAIYLFFIRIRYAYAGIGLIVFLVLWSFDSNVFHLWVLSVVLSPTLAVCLRLWDRFRLLVMPKTVGELHKENLMRNQARTDTLAGLARTKPQPPRSPGLIDLGVVVDTDIFPKHIGIMQSSGWLRMPINRLLLQSLVIGKTGSGKTELLKRIIYETLQNSEWDVVVVDAKGDKNFAREAVAMAGQAPILKMGWGGEGSAVFSGFEGDAHAVYNRLVMMFQLEPFRTDADYFRSRKRMIIQLVCGLNTQIRYPIDLFDPPRSFQELEARVSYDWLSDTYRGTDAMPMIESWKKDDLPTFRAEIVSASTPFLNLIHPNGFKFGDHRLSFFSIDTGSVPFDAGYFFRFLAGCISHYLSTPVHKKTLFVFDEPALLGVENLISLINTGRSKGGAIILATQNLATLGPQWHIVDQIFDGVNLRILMKSEATDELLERFGRQSVADTSIQLKDGAVSGTTTRLKEVFKLDASKLRQLHDGLCIVAVDGFSATMQAVMAPKQKEFTESMEVQAVKEDRIFTKLSKAEPKATTAKVPD